MQCHACMHKNKNEKVKMHVHIDKNTQNTFIFYQILKVSILQKFKLYNANTFNFNSKRDKYNYCTERHKIHNVKFG